MLFFAVYQKIQRSSAGYVSRRAISCLRTLKTLWLPPRFIGALTPYVHNDPIGFGPVDVHLSNSFPRVLLLLRSFLRSVLAFWSGAANFDGLTTTRRCVQAESSQRPLKGIYGFFFLVWSKVNPVEIDRNWSSMGSRESRGSSSGYHPKRFDEIWKKWRFLRLRYIIFKCIGIWRKFYCFCNWNLISFPQIQYSFSINK